MNRLDGRIALVTGSSRGIGRAIAIALARAGAGVVVHGRTHSEGLASSAEEVRAIGVPVASTTADLSSEQETARLASSAGALIGPIDILVNNAAIAVRTPLDQLTLGDWNMHMAVNLTAAFVLTQAVVPSMRARRWGRVLFISSTSVQNGGTVGPHYAATKGGLIGLMRGYASRVAADGVTMNAIAPGLIETDMIADVRTVSRSLLPVGRTGQPDEVADVAVMLAGNGYITGQVINVNGGWYMG